MTNRRVCLKTEGAQRLNVSCSSSHVLAQTRVENHGEKGCGKEEGEDLLSIHLALGMV